MLSVRMSYGVSKVWSKEKVMEPIEAWWVPILGTIVTAVMAGIGYHIRKLINKSMAKMDEESTEKEAMQAVLVGMAKAQDDIVREAKKASKDGKLTKEEIKEAKRVAIDHAKEIATGPAKTLLLQWGTERIGSLIKQLLTKLKKPKPVSIIKGKK